MPKLNCRVTLHRQIALLQSLPVLPRSKTVSELHSTMLDRGFDVTRRTIERDLNKLSEYGYPVFLDDSAQPNLWSMLDNSWEYQRMNIENMVALLMAKKYLFEILPDSLKDYLTKVTGDCDRVLSNAANTNGLAAWALNHDLCDTMKQHQD